MMLRSVINAAVTKGASVLDRLDRHLNDDIDEKEYVADDQSDNEDLPEKDELIREDKRYVNLCRHNAILQKTVADMEATIEEERATSAETSAMLAKATAEQRTIDDLVDEYSKLSAEAEAQAEGDAAKLAAALNRNEELQTKLQAYEAQILSLTDEENAQVMKLMSSGVLSTDGARLFAALRASKAKQFELELELNDAKRRLREDRGGEDRRSEESTHQVETAERPACEESLEEARREVRSGLDRAQKAEERVAELEARSAELDARSAELDARSAELDAHSAELQARLAEVEARSAELDSRSAELEVRSAEVKAHLAEHESHAAEHEARSAEHRASSAKLEARSAELEARSAELEARSTELEVRSAELEASASSSLTEAYAAARAEAESAVAARLSALEAMRDAMAAKAEEERARRRELHNQLVEARGNIRVYCRCRPSRDPTGSCAASFPSDEEIILQRDAEGHEQARFELDGVFGPNSLQLEVFEKAAKDLVVSALDGYSVCIFAYGQTGSGKTHTMTGEPNDRGLNFRAIEYLFQTASQADAAYSFELSILEIYNETLRDLLTPKSACPKKLDILTASGRCEVPGLERRPVRSVSDVEKLVDRGTANRAVGAHDMNAQSSRSHQIVTLHVTTNTGLASKLHLVDLAGSERISKTDATGDRLKEAQNINKSLSSLGDVIAALSAAASHRRLANSHVPFRNSKLTFFLQDSLSGDSKALMFVNVSPAPADVPESLCSLKFAARCRDTVLGKPRRNACVAGSSAGNPTSPNGQSVAGPQANSPQRRPPSSVGKSQRPCSAR